jgi:hypothetical protein
LKVSPRIEEGIESFDARTPASAHAVVRHPPLQRTLEVRQRLGRQGIDALGDAALRLRMLAI